MKAKDLIKILEENGFKLARNGGDHDIYRKGDKTVPVPRHREINEITAKRILRECGLK